MQKCMSSGRSLYRKTDILIISVFLFAALAGWAVLFWSSASAVQTGSTIEIYVDNRLVERIPLPASDRDIPLWEGRMLLALRDNRIGVVRTDCRDGICQRSGFIESPGQSIVCLPNRVVVQIVGADTARTDALAG